MIGLFELVLVRGGLFFRLELGGMRMLHTNSVSCRLICVSCCWNESWKHWTAFLAVESEAW